MRQRVLGVSGWLFAGVVLLAGAGDRGEVRCRRLVIEDEAGRPRAVLSAAGSAPGLEFMDTQGETRLMLMVMKTGQAGILFNARDGRNRVAVGLSPDGKPLLYTTDADGHRASIGR